MFVMTNEDSRATLPQRLQDRRVRTVATRYDEAIVEQDVGEGGHVDSADSDEVNVDRHRYVTLPQR
jgi:hypothetical protein